MERNEVTAIVIETLRQLGLAPELTQRAAERKYGRWFREAVKRGDLRPCRTGSRTRWYSVADILAYQARETQRARLQTHLTHNAI